MRIFARYLALLFLASAGSVPAGVITRDLAGMTVVYTGWKGNLSVTPSVANNTWNIELTDVPEYFDDNTDVTLEIKAKNQKTKDNVFIDTIRSDGALETLKIKFSAGNHYAGCVRNIAVEGKIENLIIIGGDVGAPDGQDGLVQVKGHIKKLKVIGKKHAVRGSDTTEFWGGNIWADLIVTGGIESILLKGGSLHGYGPRGTYGTIRADGPLTMKRLIVDGVQVKTVRSDPASKQIFGGSISSYINTGENEIRMLRVKGGSIYGSTIFCRQIMNLKVLGQGADKSSGFFTRAEQGIIASRIATYAPTNIIYCKLNTVSIKNGSARDSLISSMGRMNTFLVKGDVTSELGHASNLVVRSGYVGPFSELTPPGLTLATVNTSIIAGSTLVVPFTVTNGTPASLLTVRLHHRGPALNALISNYAGRVFAGTNYWTTAAPVTSGMVVWACGQCPAGTYTNTMLRVLDATVPRLYSQARLKIRVNTTLTGTRPATAGTGDAPPAVTTVPGLTFPIPSSSFAEDLRTVAIIGDARHTWFLAGIKESAQHNWEDASYLGKIQRIKVKGNACNATFASQKSPTIWNQSAFNFATNKVWVNGTRQTQ